MAKFEDIDNKPQMLMSIMAIYAFISFLLRMNKQELEQLATDTNTNPKTPEIDMTTLAFALSSYLQDGVNERDKQELEQWYEDYPEYKEDSGRPLMIKSEQDYYKEHPDELFLKTIYTNLHGNKPEVFKELFEQTILNLNEEGPQQDTINELSNRGDHEPIVHNIESEQPKIEDAEPELVEKLWNEGDPGAPEIEYGAIKKKVSTSDSPPLMIKSQEDYEKDQAAEKRKVPEETESFFVRVLKGIGSGIGSFFSGLYNRLFGSSRSSIDKPSWWVDAKESPRVSSEDISANNINSEVTEAADVQSHKNDAADDEVTITFRSK